MGRRELASGFLTALLGAGGAAVVGGLLAPHSPVTSLLVSAGVAAVTFSIIGFAGLYVTAPEGPARSTSRRKYIPITAGDFKDMVAGRTSIQISAITKSYKNKLMLVEGKVRNVSALILGYYMLHMDDQNGDSVSCMFSFLWKERLSAIIIGDHLIIEGKVGALEYGVMLESCKILPLGRRDAKPIRHDPPEDARA
jgi:hypothetical protein